MGNGERGVGTCNDNYSTGSRQRPIDASAAEPGSSVQIFAVVLMIVNATTTKTTTFVRVTRTKVTMTRAATSQSLSKDAKNCK